MAARSGQLLRNFVKLAPRSTISNASKCSYSVLATLRQSANRQVQKSLPIFSQSRINRRFYGDHADDESLEDKTMNVLKLFDKVDPSKVNIDAHFINDLGLDSLDVVEVVMAFEDEFGIEISDEEAEKIFTIQQAVDLIRVKSD